MQWFLCNIIHVSEHVALCARLSRVSGFIPSLSYRGNAANKDRLATTFEALMRFLALAVLAVGMASGAEAARAQTYDPNYPVCLQVYSDMGGYIECGYTSLAQCNMSASGRPAQCVINPYYGGAIASPGRYDRRHRRVY